MLLSSVLAGCVTPCIQQAPTNHPIISTHAESVLIYGGSILTMRGMTPEYAEAMLVQNGRIQFIGDYQTALAQKIPVTQIIHLHNQTLLPGFIDAHSHLNMWAYNKL